jgi:hypothetical protein
MKDRIYGLALICTLGLSSLAGCSKAAAPPAADAAPAPHKKTSSYAFDDNAKPHVAAAKAAYAKRQYAVAEREAETALNYEKLGGVSPALLLEARRLAVRSAFMTHDHTTALNEARALKASGKLDTDTARILAAESQRASSSQSAERQAHARINEQVRVSAPPPAAAPDVHSQDGAAQRANEVMHTHWRADNPVMGQ